MGVQRPVYYCWIHISSFSKSKNFSKLSLSNWRLLSTLQLINTVKNSKATHFLPCLLLNHLPSLSLSLSLSLSPRLKECGEDLLVDISEVLFNELTFFRLLKDFKGYAHLCTKNPLCTVMEILTHLLCTHTYICASINSFFVL